MLTHTLAHTHSHTHSHTHTRTHTDIDRQSDKKTREDNLTRKKSYRFTHLQMRSFSNTHTHTLMQTTVCVCVCVCVSMIVRAANNARPYPRIFTVRTAPQSKFRHLLRHETRKNRPNGNSPREPPFNLILIIPVNLFSFAPHQQQQQQHQQQRQRRCLIAHTRTPLCPYCCCCQQPPSGTTPRWYRRVTFSSRLNINIVTEKSKRRWHIFFVLLLFQICKNENNVEWSSKDSFVRRYQVQEERTRLLTFVVGLTR